MDTLADRIAWAIETIKSDRDLDYIQQFDEAVRNESRIKRMEEEQIRTDRELRALEERLRNEFAQELLQLRSEIKSIKNPES